MVSLGEALLMAAWIVLHASVGDVQELASFPKVPSTNNAVIGTALAYALACPTMSASIPTAMAMSAKASALCFILLSSCKSYGQLCWTKVINRWGTKMRDSCGKCRASTILA
jgi:hypothetical protein